jgi:putative membrane protein
MKKGIFCGGLLCVAAGLPLTVPAQSMVAQAVAMPAAPPAGAEGVDPANPGSAAQATLPYSDRQFFKKAAIGGLSEVAAGELAAQQGADPGIKAFGQQMVTDHQKINEDLKKLAQQKSVILPAAPDQKHQSALDKLKQKQGKDFDQAYAKQEIEDHKDTISLFEDAAKSSNPDISAFAKTTLPTQSFLIQV